ncbi:MAG: hypothetical protein KAJ00_03680 [Deltaproteobacteria bacterium]|nr:hypothetical protein [Deltaproteobacteria bacterium]
MAAAAVIAVHNDVVLIILVLAKLDNNGLPEIVNVTISFGVSYFSYVLSQIDEGINVCNLKRGKGVLP